MIRFLSLLAASAFSLAGSLSYCAENIGPLELLPRASVGSRGVFLSDLATTRTGQVVPPVLMGASPAIGRPVFISRAQVNDLLNRKAPELACTNWGGAERIRIARSARVVNEPILKEMLTSILQKEEVMDRGELEL